VEQLRLGTTEDVTVLDTPSPTAPVGRRPRLRAAGPRAGAFLGGALGILLFPAPDLGVLAWVAFVPLILLLRAAPTWREAGLRGWLGGFGFLSATIYWLSPNLVYFFPFVMAFLGLLWLPWGCAVRALLRPPLNLRRALLALITLPSGWVLIETVRSWKPFGGPWSLLGASQWDHPTELGLASVGGVWLVSFAIVAANTAVVLILIAPRAPKVVAGLVAVVSAGAGPLWFVAHPLGPATRTIQVALVQPGVIHDSQARFDEGLKISEQQLQGQPLDLVVWGESSAADYVSGSPIERQQLAALSTQLGAPVLINGDAVLPSGAGEKISYLFDGAGLQSQYAKTRLVMFGEYIPFRGELGWLANITKAAGNNLVSGPGLVVMTVALHDGGELRIAPLICFESAFPDMARTDVRNGAQLLVYQSADSTFQGSWGLAQHASLSAVRAAETGRPAVQAALSGVSAAFDAQGRELAWYPGQDVGSTVVPVPLQAAETPYDRYGNYVPVLCALVSAGALGVGLVGALRRRRADLQAHTGLSAAAGPED
jgi:apolipoprotein N-acyltransferase